MSDTITRADLAKMSLTQPENKEHTISMYVNSYKQNIIDENKKGKCMMETLIHDNRPEIKSKVVEKLKEIFVDSHITILNRGAYGFNALRVEWAPEPAAKVEEVKEVAKVEVKVEAESESDNIIKNIAKNIVKKVTMEVAEESDDEESDDEESDDEESDDDPLELNLHIVVSNSKNMDRTMEMMTACMMVITFVMSGAVSCALVGFWCKKT
jgi:hypothetical protein